MKTIYLLFLVLAVLITGPRSVHAFDPLNCAPTPPFGDCAGFCSTCCPCVAMPAVFAATTRILTQSIERHYSRIRNYLKDGLVTDTITPALQQMAGQIAASGTQATSILTQYDDSIMQLKRTIKIQEQQARLTNLHRPSEGTFCELASVSNDMPQAQINMQESIEMAARENHNRLMRNAGSPPPVVDRDLRIERVLDLYAPFETMGGALQRANLITDPNADLENADTSLVYWLNQKTFRFEAGENNEHRQALEDFKNNIYMHQILPALRPTQIASANDDESLAVIDYSNKVKLAARSFDSIMGMRVDGGAQNGEYFRNKLIEAGYTTAEERLKIMGRNERPSFYANLWMTGRLIPSLPTTHTEMPSAVQAKRDYAGAKATMLSLKFQTYKSLKRTNEMLATLHNQNLRPRIERHNQNVILVNVESGPKYASNE